MKIAIIDSLGEVGKYAVNYLSRNEDWSIYALSKSPEDSVQITERKNVEHLYTEHLFFPVEMIKNSYDYIINCARVIVEGRNYQDINAAMNWNINLPSYLAEHPLSKKVIHISATTILPYNERILNEKTVPKPTTTYQQSRALGEINNPKVTNIRARVTPLQLAKCLENIIKHNIDLPNVFHISSKGISNFVSFYPELHKQVWQSDEGKTFSEQVNEMLEYNFK